MTLPAPPPPPYYPPPGSGTTDSISLRGYLERIVADMVGASSQRWADWITLIAQKWSDHAAVHSEDKLQLQRALEAVNTESDKALDAHRREHKIAEDAQNKADHAHQTQHLALNELRNVVGDLTGNYVATSTLTTIVQAWDRRFDDRITEFNNYREGVAKEQQAYRDRVTQEISTLREAGAKGEGKGLGQSVVVAYLFAAVGVIIGAVTLAMRILQ